MLGPAMPARSVARRLFVSSSTSCGRRRERTKKSRGGPRLRFRIRSGRSECRSGEDANVRGLQALLALLHFEFDALVFGERLEAVALDVAEVGEEVGAARVLRDEAEALALVEPLHGSGLGRHKKYPVYD